MMSKSADGPEPTLDEGATLVELVVPGVVPGRDGIDAADGVFDPESVVEVLDVLGLAVDSLPDADDVPDEEGSALAGIAVESMAPPTAASPNVTRAAVAATWVLIMGVPFSGPRCWLVKGSDAVLNENSMRPDRVTGR